VDYKQPWAPWEVLPFALLGVMGGVLGGVFVLANEAVQKRRLRAQAEGRLGWFLPQGLDRALQRLLPASPGSSRIMEVVILGVFTGISNYPHLLTRMLQNDGIQSLFAQCPAPTKGPAKHLVHDPVGLCGADDAMALWALMKLLCGAAALRFLQATVTFGALVPAGIFVPSLYMGACVGRAVGSVLRFAGMSGPASSIEPGIYAMVGAGAMMAGVSRLTVCLAVVLFELTGGLTYVVPFMLSVLIAKWTGDVISNGRSVSDVHAALNGYVKVEQTDDVRFLNATLQDLSGCTGSPLAQEASNAFGKGMPPALWANAGLVRGSDLLVHCHAVDATGGFPLLSVGCRDEVDLLGWVRPSEVKQLLAAKGKLSTASDTSVAVDCWCCFTESGSQETPSQLSPSATIEDFTEALDKKGVVRVRSDCPVQTAYAIFEERPAVQALVAVDGRPFVVRTLTRELFITHILPSCICPLPGFSKPGPLPKLASVATSDCSTAPRQMFCGAIP